MAHPILERMMPGSVGVQHTALSDIRALRNILGNYHLGFPIIKELLQNADDAGATRLDVGWSPGLPESRHPLLQGPGIFVLNNGPFSDSNAVALRHIGYSDKGGQQSAVALWSR